MMPSITLLKIAWSRAGVSKEKLDLFNELIIKEALDLNGQINNFLPKPIKSKSQEMKSICVFCGSSLGNDPDFEKEAFKLGMKLAQKNIALVYGGAKIGLMGAVAKGCAENNGKVIGVIPTFLDKKEITNTDADELYQTKSMHERKMKMTQLSEGFIALPGGFGTMDELCEILTWSQLGLVKHPIGLLNINGYFDQLLSLFHHMNKNEMVKDQDAKLLIHDTDIDTLLEKMSAFKPNQNSFIDKLDLV